MENAVAGQEAMMAPTVSIMLPTSPGLITPFFQILNECSIIVSLVQPLMYCIVHKCTYEYAYIHTYILGTSYLQSQ